MDNETPSLRLTISPRTFARIDGLSLALSAMSGADPARFRTWSGLRSTLRELAGREDGAVPDSAGLAYGAEELPLEPGQRRHRLKVTVNDPATFVRLAAANYVRGRNVVEAPFEGDASQAKLIEKDGQQAGVPVRAVRGPDEKNAELGQLSELYSSRMIEGRDGDGFLAAFQPACCEYAVLLMKREPVELKLCHTGRNGSDEEMRRNIVKAIVENNDLAAFQRGFRPNLMVSSAGVGEGDRSRAIVKLLDVPEFDPNGPHAEDFGQPSKMYEKARQRAHAVTQTLVKSSVRKEQQHFRAFAWAMGPEWSRALEVMKIDRARLLWMSKPGRQRGRRTVSLQPVIMNDLITRLGFLTLAEGRTAEGAKRFNQMAALSPMVASIKEIRNNDRLARSLMEHIEQGERLDGIISTIAQDHLSAFIHNPDALNKRQLRTLSNAAIFESHHMTRALEYCRDNPNGPALTSKEARFIHDLMNEAVMIVSGRDLTANASLMIQSWMKPNGVIGPRSVKSSSYDGFPDVQKWVKKALDRVIRGAGDEHAKGEKDLSRAALALLYQPGQKIGSKIDLNQRWHRKINRLEAQMASLVDEMRRKAMPDALKNFEFFPHVAKEQLKVGDVTLTPLRSDHELLSEGREMHHCVASRRVDAAVGNAMIFSITGPGKERSTADVRIALDAKNTLTLRSVEHREFANGDPPAAHREALAAFVADVNSDRERLEPIQAWMSTAREAQKALEKLKVPGLREAVADLSFQQLQEVMPRIVKGQEKTEFLSKHLPKLVEQMEAAQPARFRGADNERPQQRAPQRASGWEMGAA